MSLEERQERCAQINGANRGLGWARMTIQFPSNNKTKTIKLYRNSSFFGKNVEHSAAKEGFIFTPENCSSFLYERISWDFFTIDRAETSPYSPAIISVLGKNGVFVNNRIVRQNKSKILRHGDILKLTEDDSLFQFLDDREFETASIPSTVLEKYHLDRYIGSGASGAVRLVHQLKTGSRFAMKMICKQRFQDERVWAYEKRIQHMLAEVESMRKLSHPNVILYKDSTYDEKGLFIIMELAEDGNLLHQIQRHGYLDDVEAKFCCYQVAQGLREIHSHDIAHRDLKAENIFVKRAPNNDIILKIGDFGYSKNQHQSLETQVGTTCYFPPEILDRHSGPYTLAADIWTLGCLFYACLSGAFPFHESYGSSVFSQIRTAQLTFPQYQWNEVSRDAVNLIRVMIQVVPESRPNIEAIVQKAWFDDNAMKQRVKNALGNYDYKN